MKVQHVIFSALCVLALLFPLQGQIPRTLPYEGIVTNDPQGIILFREDFNDFTNWVPSATNGDGCSWTVEDGWAKVATMGYCSDCWITAVAVQSNVDQSRLNLKRHFC